MINLFPFLLSCSLALHGLKKKSLSPSGAAAAFTVGFLTISVRFRTFGIALISFYLLGSRATKVGKSRKQQLEEGHHGSGAGYRNAWQVLCNSFTAVLSALAWESAFVPDAISHKIRSCLFSESGRIFEREQWCAISFRPDANTPHISTAFVLVALTHFSCCLGDTFASELGILSKSSPRLVTNFRKVPPGTNGGVSPSGTFASLIGGLLMGLVFLASILIENPACRKDREQLAAKLLLYGAFSGLIGSIIDSFLGATLQESRLSISTQKILQDDSKAEGEFKIVSGLPLLSNNQVNLASTILTCVLVLGFWNTQL